MKKIIYLLNAMLLVLCITANAQQDSTANFKVWGNCDMCQSRIEKAAKSAGATKANWDMDSGVMTVVFDAQKTSSDKIQRKIAAVGHDTERYKSLPSTFSKLPGCCQYERDADSASKSEHKH